MARRTATRTLVAAATAVLTALLAPLPTAASATAAAGPHAAAAPAFRDYLGKGEGSVVALNSSGSQYTYSGAGAPGTFGTPSTSSGWGKAVMVPFGDLNGDGCNDTLVRMSNGDLRDYPTGCGHTLGKPTSTYTFLGTGFTKYKALLYAGDLTGDGRPDLVGWSASTGDLYLWRGTPALSLGSPQPVRTGLKYQRLIAVGDVTGDGVGDLLAYDHENTLWLMAGNGEGDFAARQEVFGDWGSLYNAMVGVGDVNGDGHPDLVERNSGGGVWCNPGTGDGGFGPRFQIASGWQGYTALF